MRPHCRTLIAVAVAASLVGSWQTPSDAQLRLLPIADQQGAVALGLTLRKLQSVGTLMMTTAHPDDENNGMLAQVGMGLGWRTVLVTATRGDGGQNEIGPELFDALAVLRTEELLAAHRFDGAEQFFTRAVDFGYSFSIDETFRKWGKDEILGDFVRMLRTIRPDVVVGFAWDGRGGGQHHQASARLTAEAFRAAADPTKYPEQIKEGLRPWQARKFYYTSGFGPRPDPAETQSTDKKILPFDSNKYDPLLGRSFAEISAEARSMHKCQGMGQVLALPGQPDVRRYVLQDTTLEGGVERPDKSVVDGVDTTLASLASFAGSTPPQVLTDGLAGITSDIAEAQKALNTDGPGAATKPLASGLKRLRDLQKALPSAGLSADAEYEIAFRLAQKEQQFGQALMYAAGLRVDAIANDGLVVPGQKVDVTVRATARSADGTAAVRSIVLKGMGDGLQCGGGPVNNDRPFECKLTGTIPADATSTTPYFRRLPDAARYAFEADAPFGLPFRPSPFRAAINLASGGQPFSLDLPLQYRYEGNIFSGEKRMELHVVPAMAVAMTPEIAIVPVGQAPQRTAAAAASGGRELRVTVTNHAKGAATGEARLTAPAGWKVTPASTPVSFTREDEAVTVRFRVVPAARQEGDFDVRAAVRAGDREYGEGYQVIEYPHTQRRHVVEPAQTRVKVLDVKLPSNLTVGYVMGVGDLVPPAIEQLGARVELLSEDDLAWGDLSKYDAIVTGVRAYERRQDLRANNHRLIDYAVRGGTLIVQYNKFEFNEAQYGPYPAKVSSNRVTDEGAGITALIPEHQVFRLPNKIEASAWDGWVQERGLYFLGERDPQYVDLVESADTFEYNAGAKRGALVEAKVGKGRWVYVGLNLWRQLPAGTPGAYRLMANLLSLGKSTPVKAAND